MNNLKHLAVIADGNRRWAKKYNLPINMGYVQALKIIENSCLWGIENKLDSLTFYCFSTENWGRPENEISDLLSLARKYFVERKEWYFTNGIKVKFIGRKDRLPEDIINNCSILEEATNMNNKIELYICIDYGGKDEIVQAIKANCISEEDIDIYINNIHPSPDVIVRTGGQKRLSNFLLWQSSYAEIYFLDLLFPEMDYIELDKIFDSYSVTIQNHGK